jgi:hypothetical protein
LESCSIGFGYRPCKEYLNRYIVETGIGHVKDIIHHAFPADDLRQRRRINLDSDYSDVKPMQDRSSELSNGANVLISRHTIVVL